MFADELHYLVTDAHLHCLTGSISYESWSGCVSRFHVKINGEGVSQIKPRAYRPNKDLALALTRAHADYKKTFASAGEAILLDRDTRADLFTQLFNIPITYKHGGIIEFIFNFADRGLHTPFIISHGQIPLVGSFNEKKAFEKAIEAATKAAGMAV